MALAHRSIVTIDDVSVEELFRIFEVAERMCVELRSRSSIHHALGYLLASLFFEPSTRTRLSFETAMHRLGGRVIGFTDASMSSVAKGETLADTVRIVASYADILVLRHPREGSVRAAADHSPVPVINAGDGGHEHPTQTLTDLFMLHYERGGIDGLHIGLCGDLKYGRTVHSLLRALRHFDVRLTCIAPKALQLPPEPFSPGQKVECTENLEEVIGELDVLYMTRIQKERFEDPKEYERYKGTYIITPELLERAKPDLFIMHPLPRVDEISYRVDTDHRAVYFGQAAYGVPVRMALLLLLLGLEDSSDLPPPPPPQVEYRHDFRCSNPRCITHSEPYLAPKVEVRSSGEMRCAYCQRFASL